MILLYMICIMYWLIMNMFVDWPIFVFFRSSMHPLPTIYELCSLHFFFFQSNMFISLPHVALALARQLAIML